MAAACDILYASEHATVGMPEINVGLAGGASMLKTLFGRSTLRRMFFTGQRLSAHDLLKRNVIEDVLSEKDLLLRMMADSVSTFCVLFRHALLLGGQPPRWERREVVNAAAQHFGLDPAPFLTLLAVRDGTAKAKDIQPQMLLEEYLKQVRVVVDKVDQMER